MADNELIKQAFRLGYEQGLKKQGASTKVLERVLSAAKKTPAKAPLRWRLANAKAVWKTKPGESYPVFRGRLAAKGTAHEILGQLGKPVTYGDRAELLAALSGHRGIGSENLIRKVMQRLGIDLGRGRAADIPLLSAKERSKLRNYFSQGWWDNWEAARDLGIPSRDVEQAISRLNLVDPVDRAAIIGTKGTIGSFRHSDSVKDLADEGLKRIAQSRLAAKTNIIKSMLQNDIEGIRNLGQMRVRDLGPFNVLPATK